MNEGLDIKKILLEIKNHLGVELDYGKLTAVEKASILFSRIAVIAALFAVGNLALYYITSMLIVLLTNLTGILWVSYMIVAILLLLVMALLFVLRRQLFIDPITKFLTKLFLNPDNNERK